MLTQQSTPFVWGGTSIVMDARSKLFEPALCAGDATRVTARAGLPTTPWTTGPGWQPAACLRWRGTARKTGAL